MKNNAVKFNGLGTIIADEGVAMYEAVKEQIAATQSELKAMEEAVTEQLSGKPKKKKKKKKAAAKKGASGDGATMVGGVAVNIGDIADFKFDGLGSDSDNDKSVSGLMDL